MKSNEPVYSHADVVARLTALPGWSIAENVITRRFKTDGWRTTMMLVNAIAFLAEAANHHPDLEVHWGSVIVRLSTHSAGGVTDKDFDLATRIEALATWRGDGGFPGLQGPADGWSIR